MLSVPLATRVPNASRRPAIFPRAHLEARYGVLHLEVRRSPTRSTPYLKTPRLYIFVSPAFGPFQKCKSTRAAEAGGTQKRRPAGLMCAAGPKQKLHQSPIERPLASLPCAFRLWPRASPPPSKGFHVAALAVCFPPLAARSTSGKQGLFFPCAAFGWPRWPCAFRLWSRASPPPSKGFHVAALAVCFPLLAACFTSGKQGLFFRVPPASAARGAFHATAAVLH